MASAMHILLVGVLNAESAGARLAGIPAEGVIALGREA